MRSFEEEPNEVNEKKKIISMPVQTPKCLVGIKATNLKEKGKRFKTRNCAYVTFRLFIWKKFCSLRSFI